MIRREIIKINPLDLDTNKAVGISIPFNSPSVFNLTYNTKDQIKSNLINFLLTNKGERIMNPDFGGDIRRLIFSQIDDILTIKNILINRINKYIPILTITDVNIIPYQDLNTINISISYYINENIKNTDELSININNG